MDAKYKVGDRVLIAAIIEDVRDAPTNWPIRVKLDNGAAHTIDQQGNVHVSAIHGAPSVVTLSLVDALATVHYLTARSERAQPLITTGPDEDRAYVEAVRVIETHAADAIYRFVEMKGPN